MGILRHEAVSAAIVATIVLFGASAIGQEGVAINQLDPSPMGDRAFGVQSPDTRGDGVIRAGLLLDYAHDPLVLKRGDGEEVGSIVSDQLWGHLGGSLALFDRLTLSLEVPVALLQSGDDPSYGGLTLQSPSGTELGDVRAGARVRLLGQAREGFQLALGGHLWAPTGASNSYVSDGSFRGSGFLVLGGLHDALAWSVHGGLAFRPGQDLAGTPVGKAIPFGVALSYLLDEARTVQLGPELYGQTVVSDGGSAFASNSTVLEALLGIRWRPGSGSWVVGAGAGPSLGHGIGAPDYRVVALVAFSPEPDADRDGDGVPDQQDACPDQAGVKTPVPSTNGCPAPFGDRDADGVPDEQDACPDVWGERSEFEARNGCPNDEDGDGIPDVEDACPKQPGIRHEEPEHNGCPRARITIDESSIVITQQVRFEHGKAVLEPESDEVLQAVADILKEHPEIEKVEVQGHTDDTGPAEVNRRLSGARAQSVINWLVAHGVERHRLQGHGYGPDKPISGNDSDRGREKNRRVEFKLIKTKSNTEQ